MGRMPQEWVYSEQHIEVICLNTTESILENQTQARLGRKKRQKPTPEILIV